MSGVFNTDRTDDFDQALVVLMGGTDNTKIGNIGDRLKVDALSNGGVLTTPNNVQFLDGTLTRDTQPVLNTWTNVYSYTGSGKFYGAIVNLEAAGAGESDKWSINVVVDSTLKIFGTNGILCDDIVNNNFYDIKDLLWLDFGGLGFHDNTFRLDFKNNPIQYTTKIEVQVYRTTTLKKFKACLVKLTKDS